MKYFPSFPSSFDPFSSRDLQEWRGHVLEWLLRGTLFLWLLALITGINNIVSTYTTEAETTPNSLPLAISVLIIYLLATALLTLVTFSKKLSYTIRACGLLLAIYLVGSTGLVFSSFSGDGRVILFTFVILSSIFFDLRYSLPAYIFNFVTMLFIGWLQVHEYIVIPVERQINSTDVGAWVSAMFVFLTLSVAVLISISYLLRVLGTNLDNSHELLKREQRLLQVLRTVTDINQLIVREQDPHKLLSEACSLLVIGQGYSFAWVGLLEPDNVTLKLAAQAGDEIDPARFIVRTDKEDNNLACAGIAIRSRSVFRVTPSEKNDPCIGCPRRAGYPARSGVALPLLRNERALGVLVVDHTLSAGIFDEEEIRLLKDLSNDLAYALEKIAENERLKIFGRHQALLNEITRAALEISDFEAMLRKFLQGLEKALQADGYYFTLWDESTQQTGRHISSELFKDIFADPSKLKQEDKAFSKSILDSGHVLAVEDIKNTPHISPHLAALFPICSILGMPLIADNRRLGTLVLGFIDSHPFSADEIELVEQAARQIALAMVKASLDSDIHAKAAELEQLYAAAQDMASSLLDPPALLQKLARHMTDALQVTSGNIMSINLPDETMQVVAEYWSNEAAPAEMHSDLEKVYPTSEYATIMRSMMAGEVIVIHADQDNITSTEKEQFSAYDIKSMMFVPIMAHGQLFGDIELWESRTRREFSQAEIRRAQAMAGHAASIIENSTLFALTRQRESELGALLRVARAVSSSLQLSDVLMHAAITLSRVLRVDYCSLSDYLPDQNAIVTTALFSSDADVSELGDIGHFFSLDEYPTTKQVLESGQPIVIRLDDPNADQAEIRQLQRDNVFTSLLIPLRLRGKSLGLAELFSSDPQRTFKPEEIQFAGALADQVAVAVENARLYEKREEQEAYFRALIENSAEGVAILDANGVVRYIAPSEERLTGYKFTDIQGQSAFQYIHPEDLPKVLNIFKEGVATPGAVRSVEYRLQRKDGEWRYFEITGHNMLDDPHIKGVVANYRDVTERKQAEQVIKESQSRLEAVVSTALNGIITMDGEQKITLFNPSAERIFCYSASEVIGQPLAKLIPERYRHSHESYVEKYGASGNTVRKKGLLDSLYGRRANGEEFPMEAFISHSEIGGKKFYTVIFQDITERKQAEDALKASERKFRALAENIPSVVYQCNNDNKYTFIYLNDSIEALTGYSKQDFLSGQIIFTDLYHPDDYKFIPFPNRSEDTILNQQPFHITYRILHKSGSWVWVDEWGTGVTDTQGNVQYLEGVMIDITERKRSEEELRRHAMELETLAIATSALRTAQNVMDMVPILARQALRAVNGTYASIFLLDVETGEFVSRGWYSVDTPHARQLDESHLRHAQNSGITGRVAATGEIYMTEDIQNDPVILILDGEQERLKDVHGSVSLPLRADEKIIGVMHIWSTEVRIFTDTEIRLLIALAETASNSIHRAILFEKTQEHAEELALAYDNTLAGWARALELRDEITEGHTRRVTELTLQLAYALNIPENEIVHIRRGALLHDIGKMGIPDSILHKPGPFTAQERMIMQQHTQYARDMLASISFLQPAIDIPYCHHEHWNGAGYPRGLKGEEIPLAARIFSIIDVWDALTSDRPYRRAWSQEKTRDYILERSGKQFDPKVVETFFSLVMKTI